MPVNSLSLLHAIVGTLVALLVPACAGVQGGELPAEFLGQWYHVGSSGGIDGRAVVAGGYVVIHREGRISHHGDDGSHLGTSSFSVERGPSIFSTRDEWIVSADGAVPAVIRVSPDGRTMTLSDNVYDGYVNEYARSR